MRVMVFGGFLRPLARARPSGAALVLCLMIAAPLRAAEGEGLAPEAVPVFLEEMTALAARERIDAALVARVFEGFAPIARVMELDANQAEFIQPLGRYMRERVSETRIRRGREALTRSGALLSRIEKTVKVDKHILAAIWGVETNYGATMGSFNVAHALGTLALGERRKSFAQSQLLALLRILREEPSLLPIMGSWAGATGHMQFIPQTYERYAIDADGDGKRDLSNSLADAIGSAAHYLSRSGWREGLPWGFEARLPEDFPYHLADRRLYRALSSWAEMGVLRADGEVLTGDAQASLLLPAGHWGPAFLITQNFEVLLRYNRAVSYALSVGHLSDRLRGGAPLMGSWERADNEALPPDKTRLLQTYLMEEGLDTGGADGVAGKKTRHAIRVAQKRLGMKQDGYPSATLMRVLEGERAARARKKGGS